MTVETQECPKCGGWVEPEEGPAAAAFKLFLMGLCLVWIPVIGWVMGPILILFGGLGCLAVIVLSHGGNGAFDAEQAPAYLLLMVIAALRENVFPEWRTTRLQYASILEEVAG